MKSRYHVFGVKNDPDNTFIEVVTSSAYKVALLVHLHSQAGYKARVWDSRKRRFVPRNVIDRVVCAINRNRRCHHA